MYHRVDRGERDVLDVGLEARQLWILCEGLVELDLDDCLMVAVKRLLAGDFIRRAAGVRDHARVSDITSGDFLIVLKNICWVAHQIIQVVPLEAPGDILWKNETGLQLTGLELQVEG